MKKMLLYLVSLTLVSACKKTPSVSVDCRSPTRDPVISRQLIVGNWRWSYSNYYNQQTGKVDIWTPDNRNRTRSMTFSAEGNVTIVESGKTIRDTTYSFRKLSAWSGYPPDSTTYILSWKGSNTVFKICSDTLYLPYQSFAYDYLSDEVWEKY